MKITICTLFPEQFEGFVSTSIIKKAILQEHVEVKVVNIRDYTLDKHNRVDDKPYGGGAGLVMRAQPIMDCLKANMSANSKVIMTSASGKLYSQQEAIKLSKLEDIVIICGHYEGIDARVLSMVDEEYCIGDYILTGGELASMVISDSIIRLLDGVITKESNDEESFVNGLVEYPHYTTPFEYQGMEVPQVLASGHHKNIQEYRLKQSLLKTKKNRPDLFAKKELSDLEKKLLEEVD